MSLALRTRRGWMIRITSSVLLCGLAGCGGDIVVGPKVDATISGKVTYKGKEVTDARISFENPEIGAFGTEFKDGHYSIPKASSGEFSVTITPVTAPMSMEAPKGGKFAKTGPRTDIPKKYLQASDSRGKMTIKPGENTYDLDMED